MNGETHNKMLGAAIRKRRQALRLTLQSVADAIGSDVGNLSRMERGRQGISQNRLLEIARVLRTTPAELYALAHAHGENLTSHSELAPGPDIVQLTSVPIVGTTQAGPDRYWEELGYPAGYGEAYIDVPSKDPTAYALRVVGSSMSPRMLEGEVVLVSPQEEPAPGDEVVVRTKDGEVMVKRMAYMRDGEVGLDSISDGYHRIVRRLEDLELMHVVVAVVRASAVKRR